MIFEKTFDGGLRLLVEPTAATDVAAVGVWYNFGSRDEDLTQAGSIHVIEHMLFKGTKDISASQIARRFDAMGGFVNAFTERETMGIHATIPVTGFEEAARIITDIITSARFDPDEYERELLVIENEIEASLDDVEELATDAFAVRYWDKHPLARPICGTVKDIKNKKRDDVYALFEKYFRGKPDLITVAGGIEPAQVVSAFKDLIQSAAEKRTVPRPVQLQPELPLAKGVSYHNLSSQYVQVFYALPGPDHIDDRNYYALEIANAAIGDAMGSRLFQKLREELGLCYTIYSSPNLFRDCSMFSVYGTCAVSNGIELLEKIHTEIREIAEHGFTPDEIETAKSHLRGMITIASQDVEYRMRRLARQALYNGAIMNCTESIDTLMSIDMEVIQKSMAQFMKYPPVIFGAGPKKAAKAFSRRVEQILQSL